MKRNSLFIKIAMLVVVLTVATACVISGTFAKYTTTVLGADTISVAKFGYQATDGGAGTYTTTTAATINLFENATTDATGTVAGDAGELYLAPGVYGSFVIMLDGSTTDVDLTMAGSTVTAAATNAMDTDVDAFISYDITYGVGIANTLATPSYAGGTRVTPDAFAARIQTVLAAITLQKNSIGYVMVYWKWVDGNDAEDTALGQKWATDDTPVLTLTISNKATQIMTPSPVYTQNWLINPWVVTFNGGSGTPVLAQGSAVQLVNDGATLNAPTYTNVTAFAGWDPAFTSGVTTITADATYTAQWSI